MPLKGLVPTAKTVKMTMLQVQIDRTKMTLAREIIQEVAVVAAVIQEVAVVVAVPAS